jgi:hypothetical protein
MPIPEEELTYAAIGCSRWIYNELGSGLLESTYAGAFIEACRSKGLSVQREVFVPVYFNGVTDFELALLFNFGPTLDVKRFTLRNSLKHRRAG